MPRDKEFQRKKNDTRMPVRDSHAEEPMNVRHSEPDFDLRRARDAPSSSGTTRSQRYGAAAQPAEADSQQFTFDMPRQAGASMPEELAGRDSDYEPARGSDTGDISDQESITPETRRGDSRYEGFRQEGASGETSDTGRPVRENPGHTDRSGQTERRRRMHQYGNKYHQCFQEAAKAEEPQEKPPGAAGGKPKRPSKLEFTADELPPETADRKLTQARKKAERTTEKLQQAEECLPARRKLRMETTSDPDTGKAAKRLKFEKEVKSQQAHVKGALPMRPVKAGANAASSASAEDM